MISNNQINMTISQRPHFRHRARRRHRLQHPLNKASQSYDTLFCYNTNLLIIASVIFASLFVAAIAGPEIGEFPSQNNAPHSNQAPAVASASRPHSGVCAKSWIHVGRKCYRLSTNLKDYEAAKSKCQDLTSQLAVFEDDSAKERESPEDSVGHNDIISMMREKQLDYQSRRFYVTLSAELLKQYHNSSVTNLSSDTDDHMDLEMSEYWLPRNDPSLMNITIASNDSREPAFVLVYSQHNKRWGITPVNSTRKMSFICERPVGVHGSASNVQHGNVPATPISANAPSSPISQPNESRSFQSVPAKRSGDQATANSRTDFGASSARDQNTDETGRGSGSDFTTAAPTGDSSPSMLFREYPTDQQKVLGSTVDMKCSPLESDSTIVWTFNGRNVTQTNRVKVLHNRALHIEHARNTDGGNYTCTVYSGGMSESKSAQLQIVERPHQPEYITAELLDKLSTSVRIKWTPGFNGNSPITKYTVEMYIVQSDNIDNDLNAIMLSDKWEVAKANVSADQTSVIVPDLKPARKYIFRIRATNRFGTGEPSWPTRHPVEVPVQPPSMPPENLSGTPKSSTSIVVQWAPPPADSQNGVIKGYRIRHKLAGYASDSEWLTSDIVDSSHLTHVLEDLIVWQNYEIQVAAVNDKDVGPYSASIFVKTKEGKPDRGPLRLSAQANTSTSVLVSWRPPPPQHINGINQGYRVQVWTDPQYTQLVKEVVVKHSLNTPHHSTIVDGLLPYTEYYITIKCFTSAGDGPPSEDLVSVKTKQDKPEAVAGLEFADVLDKSLRVLWKPPNRINGELDHYTLEYSEEAALDKRTIKQYSAGATEARITDLNPQTPYVFKIYPHTSVDQGPGKIAKVTTSVPPEYPEPPTNLIVTEVGPYSATIQFVPGFDGNAHIDRWSAEALMPARGDYGPRWTTIYVSTNHTRGNSVVVRNLRPFTKYRLRLTPANIVGPSRQASEPTAEFQTAQVEPEQPPRDFSVDEIKTNSAMAHWSPLANNLWLGQPVGYNITWSEHNNSTVMFLMVNDTRADSHLIKDLEEYMDYTFRIYAVNEAGLSPSSEPVSIRTLEDVPSSGPTNITARATSPNIVSVEWGAVPKRHRNGLIKGYKVQYRAIKSDAQTQHKIVNDNSTKHVTLNDLKPFTNYQLAVAAFTSAGDGVYSSVQTVQTLEDTPEKPQNLSFTSISLTGARVLWDPPEEPNGNIVGYKVSYHTLSEGSKEVVSHELAQNERTFKAVNLKPDTNYVVTVTAKTKEGWGQQSSKLLYTYDSELRANLPYYRESWFVILCACSSIVITIIVTALLFIQTKSYKYKQDVIESTSQEQLGDAGFTIDEDPNGHYNNGFGLLTHSGAHHRRSNGTLSQSTANFTLPKTPPRPNPRSVVYSEDDGDDDVFEEVVVDKAGPSSSAGPSTAHDSSGDSITEKPSEISSSTQPESESNDEEYVNMASKNFVNHYANVNGQVTLNGGRIIVDNMAGSRAPLPGFTSFV